MGIPPELEVPDQQMRIEIRGILTAANAKSRRQLITDGYKQMANRLCELASQKWQNHFGRQPERGELIEYCYHLMWYIIHHEADYSGLRPPDIFDI